MRRTALALATAGLLALAACASAAEPAPPGPAPATASPAAPQVPGLAVYQSRYDAVQTGARVQDGVRAAGMVTAVVDHAANAAGVGQELRPTTLVIGGAPPAGTPLMLERQRAAGDLPQKYLTWQAEDGTVYLAHNSAEYVAARAGIPAGSSALDALRSGSARISAAATGSAQPLSTGAEVSAVTADGYLVERTSNASVEESIVRYRQAFADRGLMPVATVDHAMGAASVAYPAIRALAQRHAVTGAGEALTMIEKATASFTASAAGAPG